MMVSTFSAPLGKLLKNGSEVRKRSPRISRAEIAELARKKSKKNPGASPHRHLRCRTRSVDLVHEKTVFVHRSMRDLIAESSPAVVTIVCRDIDAKGTGFIISPGGHIVTNNHVVSLIDFPEGTLRVRYSTEIRVISNGRSFGASLLTDPSEPRPVVFDYAILKMEAPLPVTPLKLGTLADVRSGDQVVCLGYPLEFMQVVATRELSPAWCAAQATGTPFIR